ncbi:hypothetical protein NUW58_g2781 [Xylaria curta]|uniref:Uncharacterized protein n=1 Tax=Xylaria curta TaxID=42375 RepID=A0ACC1PDY8_9PEZI|nr:hypothetical protein NUW58_g2781 [Xylaria curta]
MKPLAQQVDPILSLGELKQKYRAGSGKRDLLSLFDRFKHSRATLQRGKLFAFLSLACDADNGDLDPDYTTRLEVIVRRYGMTFVKRGNAMNLLYRAGYLSPRFPSWIPDWITSVHRQTVTTWPNELLVARGFVFDTIQKVGQVSFDRALYLKEIFQAIKESDAYPTADKLDLLWKIPIGDADRPISGTWEEVNFRTSYEAFAEYLQLGEKMTDWETEVREMSAMYQIKQFLFRPQELRKLMWPFLYTAQEFAERFTHPKVLVMAAEEWSDLDDPEEVPLQHKRPFGSGLKRKRVVFVPASTGNLSSVDEGRPPEPSKSVSDIYLSIVLPKATEAAASTDEANTPGPDICDVCKLPVSSHASVADTEKSPSRPHEASIAHQVCISHSHPPSAVDRSRMGLGVLQAQGWDPDARTGLGASNQGISFPIKAKPKNDTLGLGVEVPKDVATRKKDKPQMLNAKKVRKMVAEDKKRHEKLRHEFYGNPEVERYLGAGLERSRFVV